jgi:hypothetical protein
MSELASGRSEGLRDWADAIRALQSRNRAQTDKGPRTETVCEENHGTKAVSVDGKATQRTQRSEWTSFQNGADRQSHLSRRLGKAEPAARIPCEHKAVTYCALHELGLGLMEPDQGRAGLLEGQTREVDDGPNMLVENPEYQVNCTLHGYVRKVKVQTVEAYRVGRRRSAHTFHRIASQMAVRLSSLCATGRFLVLISVRG